MKPSAQQQAIYDWCAQGTGNALVEAVAGSGKTTTLVNALKFMKESPIAFMAYNKKAAVDIASKCEAEGLSDRAMCGTVHSFGLKMLTANKVFPKVDEWERFNLLAEKFGLEKKHQAFYKSFLSMAKQRGFGIPGLTEIKDDEAWNEMALNFSFDSELPEDLSLPEAIKSTQVLLQSAKYGYDKFIDFDDMIWLPLALGHRPSTTFKWVLLDEAQDTNPSRRALARRLLDSSGRLIAVGDPAQAIYGFTGADNDSLKLIESDFATQRLPLHTSFRCSKAVIEVAKQWVSHIEAFESNKAGSVHYITATEYNHEWIDRVTSRDVILCRYTRPLIRLAFHLIKSGRAAKVEGRKIGEGLKALAKKFKYSTREEFNEALASWEEKELAILKAKKKNFAASTLHDKVDSLYCVADQLKHFSRQALLDKIDSIFDDKIGAGTITLMTIHRSKGLEWSTVYWYGPNAYQPSSFAQLPWEFEQEDNLCYVAATRSQDKLQIINLEKNQ